MHPFKTRPVDISGIRRLYPFQSHFMDLNGLKYHFLDEGRGRPVVMLHGNPTWSFYYRNLVRDLSPFCRCIVPDHIGCGLSDKPDTGTYDYRLSSRISDLETFLEKLNIRRNITLIVHDWGGMIGMAYAVNHPDRIGRIVILNTSAFFPPGGKSIPMRLRMIRNLPSMSGAAVQGLNLFARAALFMATSKGLNASVKKGLIAPYNCWKNRIATFKFVQDIPVRPADPGYEIVRYTSEHLHRLAHIPKLICWGEKDFVFDMDYLTEWTQRFPDAVVHTFPDAGHYILEDKPATVGPIVRNFLETTDHAVGRDNPGVPGIRLFTNEPDSIPG